MAKGQEVKLKNNIIYKNMHNKTQSILSKKERIENVKNVYNIENKKELTNKNVLLIDDIFTTGATTNECSKILKLAGAKNVDILTLAKD